MLNTSLKESTITIVLPLFCILLFSILLATSYYGYFLYFVLGIVLFLTTKLIGKELIFYFFIFVLIFALELLGPLFLLDINNNNGLNALKVHPFIFTWIIVFFLYLVEGLVKKRILIDKTIIISLLVLFAFFGITYLNRGISGISLAVHNYLGPISFFLFFYCSKKVDYKKINSAVLVFISLSALIGVLGIFEFLVQYNIFQGLYKNQGSWFASQFVEGYRIKTIIGHPLNNAIFFLFSMILVQISIRKVKLKFILLLLFTIDILLTGSRSIFIISFIVLLYNEKVFTGGWKTAKNFFFTITVLVTTVLITLNTPLGSTFINRAGSADDSANARLLLFDYFINNWTSFNLYGLGGATENIQILGKYNTPIILEIPWIMLFFDVGYFILLYILLLVLIIRKVEFKFLVIIFIIALSGFASFGVKSNVNYFLFYLLTYVYCIAKYKKYGD
ncbi:hypothetical protein A8F94_08640 [Bacillus sp. FJAT-27225]|uniref:hypothetical protein n=1 Tax=Bacillus sp. FJAT-27225 TaxID=1743144 RepID=UPI00080C3342|nr:hypothetical protein [Bacillus sp. FJAT-27225]OCA87890.1 hypothetical protein A8F94_08640 [Bacillus sp. FJAT-27225]